MLLHLYRTVGVNCRAKANSLIASLYPLSPYGQPIPELLPCTPQSLRDSQFLPCFRGGAAGGGVLTGEQSRCRKAVRGIYSGAIQVQCGLNVGADRCVCPLLAVAFSGTHKGCPYGICSLLSVLCYLWGTTIKPPLNKNPTKGGE